MHSQHQPNPNSTATIEYLIASNNASAVLQQYDAQAIQTILDQLTQALAILGSAAGQGLSKAPTGAPDPRLQSSARKAEIAMHKLGRIKPLSIPATTDLSQSLTVMVLVADMLATGQLSGPDMLESYELLHRNAQRATNCLGELRKLFVTDA